MNGINDIGTFSLTENHNICQERNKVDRIIKFVKFIAANRTKKIIVLVEKKQIAEHLLKSIRCENLAAASMHGVKSQMEGESELNDFRTGKASVLIATHMDIVNTITDHHKPQQQNHNKIEVNVQSSIILMNINLKVYLLKDLLQNVTDINPRNYAVTIKGEITLQDYDTLASECINYNGIAQMNIEIWKTTKVKNIIDIMKLEDETNESSSQHGSNDHIYIVETTPKRNRVLKSKANPIKSKPANDDFVMAAGSDLDDVISIASGAANESSPQPSPLPKRVAGKKIPLWEFLLKLLSEKKYNRIIQWETGKNVFKLLEPEIVASCWSTYKGKSSIKYVSMARSLRFYYKHNIMSKVERKQYAYRFHMDKINEIRMRRNKSPKFNKQEISSTLQAKFIMSSKRKYPDLLNELKVLKKSHST